MQEVIKKNNKYIVDIIDNGFDGEGIAKINNFTIFIPQAIKGEQIEINIEKVLSSYAFGKIVNIIKKSEFRIGEDCSTYKRCGGCSLRHIDYKETLKIKQNFIQNLVNKELKTKIIVDKIIGMGYPYNYRNKLQYPLGLNKFGDAVIGVYAKRTHEILHLNYCNIQDFEAEQIAKQIFEFIKENNLSIYNESTKKGLFRHIVIKTGKSTKEVMCILVINGTKIPKEDELVKYLTEKFKNIKTIIKNVNTKNTNVILGQENSVIYGLGYIKDYLGDYIFKISPMSFYQTNPIQAELLYNIAIEKAKLNKSDIVLDLYCGIGSISIFLSKYSKKVYGIEIVKEAIKDAKENAKINNIENIEFIVGDTENVLEKLNVEPNIIFVDPPRKGLSLKVVEQIIELKPNKIVYISCNPSTLMRDLKIFEKYYNIKEGIQGVDMFPFTSHVECVVVLGLKQN